jgi:hypothetical protein
VRGVGPEAKQVLYLMKSARTWAGGLGTACSMQSTFEFRCCSSTHAPCLSSFLFLRPYTPQLALAAGESGVGQFSSTVGGASADLELANCNNP